MKYNLRILKMPYPDDLIGGDPVAKILRQREKQARANALVTPDTEPPEFDVNIKPQLKPDTQDDFFPQLRDSAYAPKPTVGEYYEKRIKQRKLQQPRDWRGNATDEFLIDADEIYQLKVSEAPHTAQFNPRRAYDEGVEEKIRVDEFFQKDEVQRFISEKMAPDVKAELLDKFKGRDVPDPIKLALIAGTYNERYRKKYLSNPFYFRDLFLDKQAENQQLEKELEGIGTFGKVVGELRQGFVPVTQAEAALLGGSVVGGFGVAAATARAGWIASSLATGAFEGGFTYLGYFPTGVVEDEEGYRLLGATSENERKRVIAEQTSIIDKAGSSLDEKKVAERNIKQLQAGFSREDEFVENVAKERRNEAIIAGAAGAGLTALAHGLVAGGRRIFTSKQVGDTLDKNGSNISPEEAGRAAADGTLPKKLATEAGEAGKKVDTSSLPEEEANVTKFYEEATELSKRAQEKVVLSNSQLDWLVTKIPNKATRNKELTKLGKMPDNVIEWVKESDYNMEQFFITYRKNSAKKTQQDIEERLALEDQTQQFLDDQQAFTSELFSSADEPAELTARKNEVGNEIDDYRLKDGRVIDKKSVEVKDDGSVVANVDRNVPEEAYEDQSVSENFYSGKIEEQDGVVLEGITVEKRVDEVDGSFYYVGYDKKPDADGNNFVSEGKNQQAVALAALAHQRGLGNVMISPDAVQVGRISIVKEGDIYKVYDRETGQLLKDGRISPNDAARSIAHIYDNEKFLPAYKAFTECLTGKPFAGVSKSGEDVLAASRAIPPGNSFRGYARDPERLGSPEYIKDLEKQARRKGIKDFKAK